MKKPKIDGAPGLVWRPRKHEWIATWQARTDLIAKGWWPKTSFLWRGTEPDELDRQHIINACRNMQADMLLWSKKVTPITSAFDGTLGSLIAHYQTDPDSSYHKKRYHVRKNHDAHLVRIVKRHGTTPLIEIKGRLLLAWHKEWAEGGKIALAHMMIGHLRTVFSFGRTFLEDQECVRLGQILHDMRFEAPKPRTVRMTAEQATAIRRMAHKHERPSIALAQALQFDLMFRQKDCLGEWIPINEPGTSDVIRNDGMKWVTGLRWSEIDENFILRHVTSKRGKPIEIDLKLAPMVMEELAAMAGVSPGITRDRLPANGPVIKCEFTGQPWSGVAFRLRWRAIADAAGVPREIRNMDSRAGAISEATDAGADLEHVRHAATHSDIAMTQRYSRGSTEKVANVQRLRIEHRNKPKT